MLMRGKNNGCGRSPLVHGLACSYPGVKSNAKASTEAMNTERRAQNRLTKPPIQATESARSATSGSPTAPTAIRARMLRRATKVNTKPCQQLCHPIGNALPAVPAGTEATTCRQGSARNGLMSAAKESKKLPDQP